MNSIEAVNDPEKSRGEAKAKAAERPGPDPSPLRVFVRENTSYVLHYETSDFQVAMRKAAEFYDKGKDILINEKANPLVVYAKSNLQSEVDVGRVVEPVEKDGRFVRVRGEVLLAGFYEKLPLNTHAFDKQAAEQAASERSTGHSFGANRDGLAVPAGAGRSADGPYELVVSEVGSKAKQRETHDPLDLAVRAYIKAEAEPNKLPRVEQRNGETILSPDPEAGGVPIFKNKEVEAAYLRESQAQRGVDQKPGAQAKGDEDRDKAGGPILDKSGYSLPEQVLGAYVVRDGRYHDKVSDALRFEDHGKKLSTAVEDRAVIADMMAVAAAKNWNNIELKGTDTFRQMAWLEAEARGIRTKGYEPTQHDLQQLEQLKRERGVVPEPGKVNSVEVSAQREVNTRAVATERGPASSSATDPGAGKESEHKVLKSQLGAERGPAAAQSSSDTKRDEQGATQTKASAAKRDEQGPAPANSDNQAGPIIGRLIEHGPANFNHDPDEKRSYYVKLLTAANRERTVWGVDLERAMAAGDFKPGDGVSLERKGEKPVTVEANVRDGGGQVVGKEEIASHRNEWEVKPAGLIVMRALSADEKVRVDAASRVLDQELAKYPADLRREILGKVTAAAERGDLKLPTPQVTERAADAKPTSQPELERSR